MSSKRFQLIFAIIVGMIMSLLISYPYSWHFNIESYTSRIIRSIAYLLAAGLSVIIYNKINNKTSDKSAYIIGIVMIVITSLTYSISRKYIVLLVFSSLFCLPGIAIGLFINEIWKNKIQKIK